MTVTRNFPSGSYTVSTIKDNHLVSKTYYGYTRGEALALFTAELGGKS